MFWQRIKWIGFALFIGMVVFGAILSQKLTHPQEDVAQADAVDTQDYIVLAWNDLGMHCYNRDFQDLAVLPPYNTLWAQVIKTGDPPQLVTSGITVTYTFPDNTYSVGKSNFWDCSIWCGFAPRCWSGRQRVGRRNGFSRGSFCS